MSLQKVAEDKMEKAIKSASDDEPQFAVTETEDGKIKFSGDVLRKFLEWIPMENLPNVTPTSRRFWSYCDENLEERKYVIQHLYLSKEDSSGADQLEKITLEIDNDGEYNDGISVTDRKTVEFAEVAPPTNFRIKRIYVNWNIGKRAMDFLRLTADELFVGAELQIEEFNRVVNVVDLYKFFGVFHRCAGINLTLVKAEIELSDEFFSKPAVSNCNYLFILTDRPVFDSNSVFNWLHAPPTIYPKDRNYKRLYWLEDVDVDEESLLSELLPRITTRFLEDNEKIKFMLWVSGHLPKVSTLRLENQRTGELLFGRIVDGRFELFRCLKEEEGTMTAEDIVEENNTKITMCKNI